MENRVGNSTLLSYYNPQSHSMGVSPTVYILP